MIKTGTPKGFTERCAHGWKAFHYYGVIFTLELRTEQSRLRRSFRDNVKRLAMRANLGGTTFLRRPIEGAIFLGEFYEGQNFTVEGKGCG